MDFLSTLETIVQRGLPQEKLVAIRQCIRRIKIDKLSKELAIEILLVPASSFDATESLSRKLSLADDAECGTLLA